MRLRTRRTVHELHDAAGALLAEVAVDDVEAWRLHPTARRGRPAGGRSRSSWRPASAPARNCWTRSRRC
ncbi:hypothetical protein O1L55_15310 [Streptomyces albulus]|nr:hypothetical protein [Streptomyces noursei]